MGSPVNVTWNNELIFTLISMYEQRRLLWDTSLIEHKDKKKKHEAWMEIAKHFNTDRETVEKKMKILTTQFRREMVKVGDETKWFAYKKLMFLKSRLERPSITFVEYDTQFLKEEDNIIIEQPVACKRSKPTLEDSEEQPVSYKIIKSLSEQRADDKIEEMYRLMKEIHSDRHMKDEFTVFGEHVAAKLRKLNNLYARCTAQYNINNILYKAEIGEYDELEDKT